MNGTYLDTITDALADGTPSRALKCLNSGAIDYLDRHAPDGYMLSYGERGGMLVLNVLDTHTGKYLGEAELDALADGHPAYGHVVEYARAVGGANRLIRVVAGGVPEGMCLAWAGSWMGTPRIAVAPGGVGVFE